MHVYISWFEPSTWKAKCKWCVLHTQWKCNKILYQNCFYFYTSAICSLYAMVRILFIYELDIMFIYTIQTFCITMVTHFNVVTLTPEENFKPAYLMNYKASKTCWFWALFTEVALKINLSNEHILVLQNVFKVDSHLILHTQVHMFANNTQASLFRFNLVCKLTKINLMWYIVCICQIIQFQTECKLQLSVVSSRRDSPV